MTHSNGIPNNINKFIELREKGGIELPLTEENLASIFEADNSTFVDVAKIEYNDENNLTVEDYEKMFPIVNKGIICTVERPTTKEFQDHDKVMEMLKAEYLRNHPEPKNSNPYAMNILGGSEHDKWEKEMEEYMDAQETIYRESHPEYAKQAQAYDNQKRRTITMM